jgi:hypothetical protein
MKIKKCCYFCLFLAVPLALFAQTADRIDGLLETKAVNYGQAAQLILEAADISPADFNAAMEKRWLPKKADADADARLDGVSLLIMRAFDIKGGAMYSLFKNPHYAYRELVYKEVIQGRSDPEMAVSGNDLLFLVSRMLSFQEAGLAGERE